jgi:hypothetical protein
LIDRRRSGVLRLTSAAARSRPRRWKHSSSPPLTKCDRCRRSTRAARRVQRHTVTRRGSRWRWIP